MCVTKDVCAVEIRLHNNFFPMCPMKRGTLISLTSHPHWGCFKKNDIQDHYSMLEEGKKKRLSRSAMASVTLRHFWHVSVVNSFYMWPGSTTSCCILKKNLPYFFPVAHFQSIGASGGSMSEDLSLNVRSSAPSAL